MHIKLRNGEERPTCTESGADSTKSKRARLRSAVGNPRVIESGTANDRPDHDRPNASERKLNHAKLLKGSNASRCREFEMNRGNPS